jgi:hypothetical protein
VALTGAVASTPPGARRDAVATGIVRALGPPPSTGLGAAHGTRGLRSCRRVGRCYSSGSLPVPGVALRSAPILFPSRPGIGPCHSREAATPIHVSPPVRQAGAIARPMRLHSQRTWRPRSPGVVTRRCPSRFADHDPAERSGSPAVTLTRDPRLVAELPVSWTQRLQLGG